MTSNSIETHVYRDEGARSTDPTAAVCEVGTRSDVLVARHHNRDLLLDLVVPTGTSEQPSVVVWIHGGGFLRGNRKKVPELRAPLLTRGIAVASIEYRLSQEATFPAQLYDVREAIRYLRAHSTELGIDPSAFGLWGASAGGHLAALAGLTGNREQLDGEGDVSGDVSVRAVANAYGLTDVTASAPPSDVSTVPGLTGTRSVAELFLGAAPDERPELARAASPVLHVRQDAPPFQTCHGTADPLVSWAQSWNLHKALVGAGAESELFLLDGYRHGFVNAVRRGDLETEELLDGGRLAAEGAAVARRYTGVEDGGQPAEFGFDHIASFFARHLRATATPPRGRVRDQPVRAGSGPRGFDESTPANAAP
jgi:acetyl esterase/lipase